MGPGTVQRQRDPHPASDPFGARERRRPPRALAILGLMVVLALPGASVAASTTDAAQTQGRDPRLDRDPRTGRRGTRRRLRERAALSTGHPIRPHCGTWARAAHRPGHRPSRGTTRAARAHALRVVDAGLRGEHDRTGGRGAACRPIRGVGRAGLAGEHRHRQRARRHRAHRRRRRHRDGRGRGHRRGGHRHGCRAGRGTGRLVGARHPGRHGLPAVPRGVPRRGLVRGWSRARHACRRHHRRALRTAWASWASHPGPGSGPCACSTPAAAAPRPRSSAAWSGSPDGSRSIPAGPWSST